MTGVEIIAVLNALLGIGLKALETREQLKIAALAGGQITQADLDEQEARLAGKVDVLKKP